MSAKSEFIPLRVRRWMRLNSITLYRRVKSHNQFWLKEELCQPFGELMWVRDSIVRETS